MNFDWEVKTYGTDHLSLPNSTLWDILWSCKTRKDFLQMQREMKNNERALKRVLRGESSAQLELYGMRMLVFGIIRGMQQGALLGVSSATAVTAPILSHPSIAKLLVRKRIASSLAVCEALDGVKAELPSGGVWSRLKKKDPRWVVWADNPNVKMAISNARKDAQQAALDEKFLVLIKGIGLAGSIFEDEQFNLKPRKVGKHR